MKESEIKLRVILDDENIPEQIFWDATEKEEEGEEETKSVSLNIWDHKSQNTLRIDLWNKEMPTDEMKRFYVDCLGGLAQSILNSTGDEFMSTAMNRLCDKLVKHLEEEAKNGNQ
ncbi:gliding motility-associated protein GldC [Roseivirga ehrenbergii]|uniref:Gliding motility protein GldC n=1 Tax=Roseivirga ehrenbergii (strain DSM 102268 / JCM 13514 / KCTC 12282 / NCIMB 14502 / KMM 6017) TaxID=279360 RepID=A0A150WZ56_ROSEK|nr:gliding motility protein GldC [Roseivirga ehrenbergii]KYG71768.1 gliding motility protein GldC [Roseivirga ehrenbergii]TCL07535.1 gliding motility-associated protein GldC [Roseivirga ehrenbergii]